jgi:hypothetical protein
VILKSFGCSFIFGSELHDDGPSQYTWPALWAKHLKLDYQCFAQPGSGNTRITEQILNQIKTGDPALYVIGWTWIERFDFVSRSADSWNTITAWSTDSVAKNYYRDIHSQYYDKLQSLIQINLVLQQLIRHKCKFYMTFMDDLIFETEYHCSPTMILLQQQLRPFLHNFQGRNFLDWSKDNGFAISSHGKHPLEQAHQAAFEYIKSTSSFDHVVD